MTPVGSWTPAAGLCVRSNPGACVLCRVVCLLGLVRHTRGVIGGSFEALVAPISYLPTPVHGGRGTVVKAMIFSGFRA